jgi:hypothetical protein
MYNIIVLLNYLTMNVNFVVLPDDSEMGTRYLKCLVILKFRLLLTFKYKYIFVVSRLHTTTNIIFSLFIWCPTLNAALPDDRTEISTRLVILRWLPNHLHKSAIVYTIIQYLIHIILYIICIIILRASIPIMKILTIIFHPSGYIIYFKITFKTIVIIFVKINFQKYPTPFVCI